MRQRQNQKKDSFKEQKNNRKETRGKDFSKSSRPSRSSRPFIRKNEKVISVPSHPVSLKKGNVISIPSGKDFQKEKKVISLKTKYGNAKANEASDLVRLNKYIANTGVCSRREADEYIKLGLVSVNGKVVTEMGTKISVHDEVKYNDVRLKREKNIYLILNKPKDYVTTVEDPHAEKTVMELIKGACKERVYPVGRLDRNTTGILLFTNDGDLTKKLTHPKYNKKKIYHAFLDKNLKNEDIRQITEGIELEDGFIKVDAINYVDPVDKKQVGIEIHSGRNRIIRRIFEHLGYRMVKLDRVFFAGLTKKGLKRGQWRFLTDQEIASLKMGNYA
jgi:23S rRNA pseudouridine2605 synthase